ncbi:hypothetical protein BS78_05G139900 [Paspalum vaginatum]|nr:hypothetical protein BS78_05G139900 [Paspalum vaginatum]
MLKPTLDDPGSKQFKNENYNLTMLRHQNIVQILGYCYEIEKEPIEFNGEKVLGDKPKRAICLEYLEKGSLEKHLSDDFGRLGWDTWFKIIKGICEGLKYTLHELKEPLYHLDLKPDNILLDKDLVPKIADFGLSKFFSKELTWTTQNAYGTIGYQPPEYIDKREISRKFDIFSLGVIMMKIVSGSEGYKQNRHMSSDEIIEQVGQDWRNKLQATCSCGSMIEAYCHQVKTCTHIALNCLEENSKKRPDIVNITEMLNEIDRGIDKLSQKGYHKAVSKISRLEPNDVICGHQHNNLMAGPSCSELGLYNAGETLQDVVEKSLVGRTEEKRVLMDSLLKVISKDIVILPIHGIGGIGKTTFARLFYDDPKFKCYSRVWVHVSQIFDMNKINESIISQLSSEMIQTNETQMIHNRLRCLLSGKKILIILDDMWEDKQLELDKLSDMLSSSNSNIIVIVTTRNENVAKKICTNIEPHKISLLTDDMCWEIIKQRSGFYARDDKEQLEDIGKEIAQKCAGVALAAQSLGFTLRSKNSEQWMEVKVSAIWNDHDSKDVQLQNRVLASLKLSYESMDPCMKSCFIYCGLSFFQQSVSWSPKSHLGLYEKDNICFTMHDLVHDLTASILGDEILDQRRHDNARGTSCRYALLNDCRKPLGSFMTSPAALTALRFMYSANNVLDGSAFPLATSLRVLDLSKCASLSDDILMLPDSIGELKQLRYLNAPKILVLPECIGKLSNMTYLILWGSSISKLPNSIGELKSLRHLDLSYCKYINQLPVSFCNLSALIYLDLAESSVRALPESIGELKSLRHLDLSYCTAINQLPASTGELKNLRHLDLSDCHNISGLSEWLGRLTRLEHLNLRGCSEYEVLAGQLGGLAKLQHLNLFFATNNLRDMDLSCFAGKGERSISVTDSICELSNLEHLDMSGNRDLCRIPDAIRNLSKLHTLNLSINCFQLECLPYTIAQIDGLKNLDVSGCRSLDMSTLPQCRKSLNVEPYFAVICGLKKEECFTLNIAMLENVKSAEEACRIKLAEWGMSRVELVRTGGARRFVDDEKVLEQLTPPATVTEFVLQGYRSAGLPFWMMGSIATFLPSLKKITLRGLPSCDKLPPLGRLPNLEDLSISWMDKIRKIDEDLYGGATEAFPKLEVLRLDRMEYLEEWDTPCEFPILDHLSVENCPKLRFKSGLIPRSNIVVFPKLEVLRLDRMDFDVFGSDNVIWSPLVEDSTGASSPAATRCLEVGRCDAPPHQWSLLRHLCRLQELRIESCSDLTCMSADILQSLSFLKVLSFTNCNSMVALPEWLGDLTSLEKLLIDNCQGISTLPNSIGQLKCIKYLVIDDALNWFSGANRMRMR